MITITTEITEDHLVNLFVAAIESNCSTYWAGNQFNVDIATEEKYSTNTMSWWFNPEFFKSDFKITVGISETDEPYYVVVTPQSVKNGLQLAAEHFPAAWQEFQENNGFDNDISDTIMQCIVLHDQIVKDNTTGWNAHAGYRGWQTVYG